MITAQLETYEWDNVWWEQTNLTDRPRVLYIGDSISCALRHAATRLSDSAILFDGFGSSKALDHPCLCESIRLFARQQNRRDLVLFNSGLHGFHLSDDEEYPAAYERMIRFLTEEFRGTPLACVLTTCAADEHNARVIARNRRVSALAAEYSLPVIDLYAPSVACAGLHSDVYHFSAEGNEKLAGALLEAVKALLAAGRA